MRTSPQLSSSWTFTYKWGLPAFFLPGLIAWIYGALRHPPREWTDAGIILLIGIGVCYWLIWTRPIKRVTVECDHFVISNCFTSHRVPVARLASITEIRDDRVPTITLYFEPPTPFGGRVRIIPPVESSAIKHAGFDEAVTFLRGLLDDHERPGAKVRAS